MRLDDTARMNTPGKAAGNWAWRVGESDVWDQLKDESEELRKLVEMYDRLAPQGERRKEVEGESNGSSAKKQGPAAVVAAALGGEEEGKKKWFIF